MANKGHPSQIRAWPFIVPGLAFLFVVSVIPLLTVLRFSLYQARLYEILDPTFVGFKHYVDFLRDMVSLRAVRVTIVLSLSVTALSVLVGLLLAGAMSNRDLRFKNGFLTFFLIPFVTTPIVVGFMWRIFMFEPTYGLVNFVLNSVGIPGVRWLTNRDTALLSLIMTSVWRLVPLSLLVLYAAISTISDDLIDSARIDGASGPRIFRSITVPLIRGQVIFTALLIFTSIFREFDTVYSLTFGGPGRTTTTLSLLVYFRGMFDFRIGVASTISTVMFIVVAFLALLFLKIVIRNEEA